MHGEDLPALSRGREVQEEDLVKAPFAEEFGGSLEMSLAVATTKQGTVFSAI